MLRLERHSSEGLFAVRDGDYRRSFAFSFPPWKLAEVRSCVVKQGRKREKMERERRPGMS